MAKIILKYKDAVIQETVLDKGIVAIGRKPDNNIIIENQAVSGQHAIIETEGDQLFVEDLKSLNGTYLNGRRITRAELFNKDIILIGVHQLEIVFDKDRLPDQKAAAGRGRSMFETIVITPEEQKKILLAANKAIPDVLGGFLVIKGSGHYKDYVFKEKISTIGREKGSAIRLKGFFAPRRAALVNRRKEGYFITPTGSKTIKINGNAIDQRYDLKDGDIVDIGRLKLQFYIKEYHAKPAI
ncbi:MAG: FHA domain-containing protein [Deltaproteobacteria bacterium]